MSTRRADRFSGEQQLPEEQALPSGSPSGGARWRNRTTVALAILILVPSLWGFGSKFSEFLALVRGEVDGAFAITPVVNYLLASLGFLCLFGWAALNGMFRDIERPKRTMLENEAKLDRAIPPGLSERATQYTDE